MTADALTCAVFHSLSTSRPVSKHACSSQNESIRCTEEMTSWFDSHNASKTFERLHVYGGSVICVCVCVKAKGREERERERKRV